MSNNTWPQNGLTTGIDFNAYRSDDITIADTWESVKGKAISKSLITNFIADPAAWKSTPKKDPTAAMQAGSLLDCLITEPSSFDSRYHISIYDEFRTNESKAWRSAQEAAGIVVITKAQYEAAWLQREAIYNKPESAALLDCALFQVAFRHETAYPFASKGLIDVLPTDKDTIVDIKTCQPCALESKRSLSRYIFDWMYHVQAGAYIDGYNIASGEERHRFKFIFVTSTPPYRVAVVELPYAAISHGADIYRHGAKRFAECLESNTWPSIWDGEVELDIPAYGYEGEGEG